MAQMKTTGKLHTKCSGMCRLALSRPSFPLDTILTLAPISSSPRAASCPAGPAPTTSALPAYERSIPRQHPGMGPDLQETLVHRKQSIARGQCLHMSRSQYPDKFMKKAPIFSEPSIAFHLASLVYHITTWHFPSNHRRITPIMPADRYTP